MKVEYKTADGVAVLTLNDPPANTYSYEMMQELDACILKARMDEERNIIWSKELESWTRLSAAINLVIHEA